MGKSLVSCFFWLTVYKRHWQTPEHCIKFRTCLGDSRQANRFRIMFPLTNHSLRMTFEYNEQCVWQAINCLGDYRFVSVGNSDYAWKPAWTDEVINMISVSEARSAVSIRAIIGDDFLHGVYTLQPVVELVGWTMQMSLAKRRLSGPARTPVTSSGWRAQQGGCVDSGRCGAFGRNFKNRIRMYLFTFLPSVAYDPELHKTRPLCLCIYLFVYLFIYLL